MHTSAQRKAARQLKDAQAAQARVDAQRHASPVSIQPIVTSVTCFADLVQR